MGRTVLFILALIAASAASATWARDHQIDNRSGSLQNLISSGNLLPGDRILLASGKYGALTIRGRQFTKPVVLAAAPGAKPVFSNILLNETSGWRLQGLTVSPGRGQIRSRVLVEIRDGRDIILDGLTIASAASASGWSAATWRTRAHNGIRMSGRDITVRNSHIHIVRHGIESRATGALVENNVVTLFAGDGMRGLGDNSVYRGNRIETCVKIDGNHDDGFQSWSTGPGNRPGTGVIRNVTLAGNVIVNGDAGGKLRCVLQGIGMFDGIYENWVIRDNIVVVDHWHGITVMGGRRVQIRNNIVVDARHGQEPGPPWISITHHKDGRTSQNSVISGNVFQAGGTRNKTYGQPQPGVRVSGNTIVETPEDGLALGR